MAQTQISQKESAAKNKTSQKRKNLRGPAHHDDSSRFAITIGAPPDRVFSFFRDFKNIPFFMKDIKAVDVLSVKLSHWVVQLDSGLAAEWDAEITSERKNEMIAWRSIDSSAVKTSGAVWFTAAPQNRGSVVSLLLNYKVPGGKLTELITKLNSEDPDSLAQINLRRLKAHMETGEIATIFGQSSGRDEDNEIKH